ncbi:FAD-dependent oxidoreductase [Roseibium salinum]|nr:FAD-dependent oxidoreductase [Roseibium salinum]
MRSGWAGRPKKAGATLFEETRVTGIEGKGQGRITVKTARGNVSADHLVLACNGYLGGLDRQTAAHVMPINNFVVATEPFSEDEAEKADREQRRGRRQQIRDQLFPPVGRPAPSVRRRRELRLPVPGGHQVLCARADAGDFSRSWRMPA